MAGEKESSSTTTKLKTRIRQKHDTETNWLKATTFVPLDGELIIYDVDDTHSTPRFKVGDGIQVVGDLPFLADGINSQYLRNNYIPIKEITSGSFIVPQIGYNKEIYWLNSDVSVVEQSLAQRYTDGRLRVGDPVENNDAVNLLYLDNHFVAGNGISIDKKANEEKVEIKIDPTREIKVSTLRSVPSGQTAPFIYIDSTIGITYKPDASTPSRIFTFPSSDGTLTTQNSFKTINGNSIVGSGDITISGGSGDVTAAGDNTFTGTNVFTSNTLEVGDGKDKISDNGKAVIISATGIKIYDGLAGRNYTVKFPTYEKGNGGTLATLADVTGDISSSANNTFTGTNIFKKSVSFDYGLLEIRNVSTSSSPNTDGIIFKDSSNNTFCWYQGTKWTTSTGKVIQLPTSAGTLALTSDIKIKSASLDGTTLTLTI